jgi:1-acyl-sn-glycerol-3-phosphate acyltransferase
LNQEDKITPPLTSLGLANRIFFRLQILTVVPLLKVFFRFKSHGLPIPASGPVIVAANHESLIDPVILQAAVSRRLHYLMSSDFYFKPVMNRYSRIMRCIPVMEERFNREAIRTGIEVLAAGRALGVFPQGMIRPSGDVEAGMRGIAMLAAKSGASVIPVRIRGTGRALPRGARFIRPTRLEVHRGDPVEYQAPSPGSGRSRRGYLVEFTESVMNAIENL